MQKGASTRTRTNTKFLAKAAFKPDSGVSSALNSMKQNPKFSRLLGFSMNCLSPFLTPPNPRHRDNANFVISNGGHLCVIRALEDHIQDDNILFNAVSICIKLIGRDKFKDEEIAKLVVDCGGIQAIINAMNHPSEKSKHTVKAMIELLHLLGVNPNLATKLVEQGTVEATLGIMKKMRLNEETMKSGLEALQKITSHHQAKQALISRNVVGEIISLLEKKSASPAVVQAGLKLIDTISKTLEGVEYLKKDGRGMQAIVSLMEKHSNERGVLNLGASILGRIATISDLHEALNILLTGGDKSVVSAALLSQLILVDEMMEEVIKKGGAISLIAIIKQNTQFKELANIDQAKLIKHCVVAIGRIAGVDQRQLKLIVDQGALEVLNEALDLQDVTVIEACVNTLQKLAESREVLEKLASSDCIKKVLEKALKFSIDRGLSEAVVNLVATLINDENLKRIIIENNGIEVLIKLMKAHPKNKRIIENGTKTLGSLMVNEDAAKTLLELGTVEFLVEVTQAKPHWRKVALNTINLFDSLSTMENMIPLLKKVNGLSAIVSILSGKNFDPEQYNEQKDDDKPGDGPAPRESILEENALFDEESLTTREADNLSSKQETELNDVALVILEKLVKPEEIKEYKQELLNVISEFDKKNDQKNSISLQYKIISLGYLALVPTLGEAILRDEVCDPILFFSRRLNSMKDFDSKNELISSIIQFFSNISYLNTRDSSKALYQNKRIGEAFINFLNEILEKNQEPNQVIHGLKCLRSVLAQKIGGKEFDPKRGSKRLSLLDVASYNEKDRIVEKIIEGVINNMKKYPDDEEIQLNAIEVFNTMSQLSSQMNSSIVKLGGSSYIISRLEEDMTSKKVGKACLQLLRNIGSSSKDAIILMNNQRAAQAVMTFLSNHRNTPELAEIAAPLLKQLAAVENSELTKDLENDIKDLIQTIDPDESTYDKQNAIESLDLLTNFALLEKSVHPIIKYGAVRNIAKILSIESKEDQGKLIESGQLFVNERLISAGITTVNRLITSPQAIKCDVHKSITETDLLGSVIDIIKKDTSNKDLLRSALIAGINFLNNDLTKNEFLKKGIEADIINVLTDLLEKFKEESDVTSSVNKLIFGLCKSSHAIASKLGEKNFVKNLVKETKSKLKEISEDQDALRIVKQNLQCLTILADIEETALKIHAEGGIELAVSILRKENYGTKPKTSDEKLYGLNTKNTDDGKTEEEDLSEDSISLLARLVKNADNAQSLLPEGSIPEILQSLENHAQSKALTISTLSLLKSACKDDKILKELEVNNAVESVIVALNCHPIDNEVKQLGGELMGLLQVNKMLQSFKTQYLEMAKDFSIDDEKKCEQLKRANIHLSNLLLTKREDQEDEATITLNTEIIKSLEVTFPLCIEEGQELLATELLLISRFSNEGEKTKALIRESKVTKILINDVIVNHEIINPDNGNIPVFSLEAGQEMIGRVEPKSIKYNAAGIAVQTPKEELEKLNDPVNKILLAENGESLEEVFDLTELRTSSGDKPFSIDTIQLALGYLSRLANNDDAIVVKLIEFGGIEKIKELFQDISAKGLCAVTILGPIISALSRTQDGFAGLVAESEVIPKIVDVLSNLNINQEILSNKVELKTLKEGLLCLGNIINNDYDKSELVEMKVAECVIEITRKLNQIPVQNFRENPILCQCLINAFEALKIMEVDPGLGRIIAKNDGVSVLTTALNKYSRLKEGVKTDISSMEPLELKEIAGNDSGSCLEEHLIFCLEKFSSNPKYAEKLRLLDPKETVSQDLIHLIETNADCPLIVFHTMKTIENCIKTYTIQQVEESKEIIAKLADTCGQVQRIYPNIVQVQKISKNIAAVKDGFDPANLEQREELENQMKNAVNTLETESQSGLNIPQTIQDIVGEGCERKRSTAFGNTSDLLSKLDFVSDSIEHYVKRANSGKVAYQEESQIAKLIATVSNFSAAADKILKLHNMGVTDSLLNLIDSEKVNDNIKLGAIETISKLTQDPKLLDKFEGDDKLTKTIVNAIFNAGKKNNFTGLQKNIIKKVLDTAGNLSGNPNVLKQFVMGQGVKAIIEFIRAVIDIPDLIANGINALAKLAVNDEIIAEIIKYEGLELTVSVYEKFKDVIELLRALALLVGKLGKHESVRKFFSQNEGYKFLIDAFNNYKTDIVLGTNTAMALGWLSYSFEPISNQVIKTAFVNQLKDLAKANLTNASLIENTCHFYNGLAYRNPNNKRELGKSVLTELVEFFDHYSSSTPLKSDALKQCFKAIGNIALFFENTVIVVSKNFVQSACLFITNHIKATELIKFSIDIFTNLTSFPEDLNRSNVDSMIKQGLISTILNCIKENELNTEILQSTIQCLDNVCLNKQVRPLVGEREGVPIVLKVLKSQDWNKDIVFRCLRILSSLASVKEVLDNFVNHKVYLTIINVIRAQKLEDDILVQALSIMNKISVDKPICKLVYSGGFVETAFDVLESHTLHIENLLYMLAIFSKLSKYSEEASILICQKGAHIILESLESKLNDLKLVKQSTVLLENLSNMNTNIDILIQNNAINIINKILAKVQTEEEPITSCFRCLASIALTNEEYRKLCLDANCVVLVQTIIDLPTSRDLLITEGKLAIQAITSQKIEVPPEEIYKKKEPETLVTTEVRNFLVAGKICRLFKKDGSSKEMHLFMTADLKEIMAKRPKRKEVKQQWRLPIHQVKELKTDFKDKLHYNQSAFAKSGGLFKKKANPEMCFAFYGPHVTEGQRTFSVECSNMIDKKKWCENLNAVLEDYKRTQKKKM